MGVVGFACWVLMTSQRSIYEELKESRLAYMESLKESRQEYRADLMEMRTRYSKVAADNLKMLLLIEAIHHQVGAKK
jgi:hypothetical protein